MAVGYEGGLSFFDGPDEETDEHMEEGGASVADSDEYETFNTVEAWLQKRGPDWASACAAASAATGSEELGMILGRAVDGICVAGHLHVTSSAESGQERVARAFMVVKRGPPFLRNRHVRIYTLQHRNRARQSDEVWVRLLWCEVDPASIEQREAAVDAEWDPLSSACLFGRVLRAEGAPRTDYLCRLAQVQWCSDRQLFLPFSREVPAIWVHGRDRLPLDKLYKVRILRWPPGSPRPLAEVVNSWEQPTNAEACLRIYREEVSHVWHQTVPELQAPLIDSFPEREDLTDCSVFTVDCEGARVLDDALDYDAERNIVRIHIADVAAIVPSGSEVDDAAMKRGCTLHLRDHSGELSLSSQMLPEPILAAASLQPEEVRRAITFQFLVDGGRIVDKQLFRSIIRSRVQLSYSEATAVMRGENCPSQPWLAQALKGLQEISFAVEARLREEDPGALLRSTALRLGPAEELPAQRLVEFWMSQVNEHAGAWLWEESRQSHGISCGLSFPMPDGVHLSRLAAACSETLLGGVGQHAQGVDAIRQELQTSSSQCRRVLGMTLFHALRSCHPSNQQSQAHSGVSGTFSEKQCAAAGAFLPLIYARTPTPFYASVQGAWSGEWPILHSSRYYQVTSPLRRWVDLLGQHLLFRSARLEPQRLTAALHHYNEISRRSSICSDEYKMLSFATSLRQAEMMLPSVIGSLNSATVQLTFPAAPEMMRPVTIPLGVLQSDCLTVQYKPDKMRATLLLSLTNTCFDLVPFATELRCQVGVNSSGPVPWGKLAVVAIEIPFSSSEAVFRHSVLPRQCPEIFGPPPDLRQMQRLQVDGAEWSRVWHLVKSVQVYAAALIPRDRSRPPYFRNMACSAENPTWTSRGALHTLHATVLSTYRGLEGLVRLQEGHIAIASVIGQRDKRWTGFGRIVLKEETDELRRKSQLCVWVSRGASCRHGRDCWYAHGDTDLRPAKMKVVVELSPSSSRAIPAWVPQERTSVELEFVAVSQRDQQSANDILQRVRPAVTKQQTIPTPLRRLLLRNACRGTRSQHDQARGQHLGFLNHYQQCALDMALREPLCYVQGPPGTGKSTVAAQLICHLLADDEPRSGKHGPHLLVCAPSNKACDRLLRLVMESEQAERRRIVRVYARSIEAASWPDPSWCWEQRQYAIQPALQHLALHEQVVRDDPLLHAAFVQAVHDMRGDDGGKPLLPSKLHELDSRLKDLKAAKHSADKRLLMAADVVFTTLDCASHNQSLRRMSFAAVVVDEAAQAIEADLANACVAAEHKIVLFGDHQQLGPVMTEVSIFPPLRGLASRSLFERVVSRRSRTSSEADGTEGGQRGTMPHVTLRRQYRMHPSISAFPSSEFYKGELVDDAVTIHREGLCFPSQTASRMAVVDVHTPHSSRMLEPDTEFQSHIDHSLCNVGEAELATSTVVWLLQHGVDLASIAVVTPYRAQTLVIKEMLEQQLTVDVAAIMIGTVHLLQGEERDYIILSLVRSHACAEVGVFDPVPACILEGRRKRKHGSVGFLADRRMANVALSRASHGLFVFGNFKVLSCVAHWANLFHHAQNTGATWTASDAAKVLRGSESVASAPLQLQGGGAAREEVSSDHGAEVASGLEDFGDSDDGDSEYRSTKSDEEDAFADVNSEEEPASTGSVAPEMGRHDPAASALSPAHSSQNRRRRKKKRRQRTARAAGVRAPADVDEFEWSATATSAIDDHSRPTTESSQPSGCLINGCRGRVRSSSAVAARSGLCVTHWIQVEKEVDFLQQPQSSQMNALEFFTSPAYWQVQPTHDMVARGLQARSFFSAVAHSLVQKGSTIDGRCFARTLCAMSGLAYHRKLGLEEFPEFAARKVQDKGTCLESAMTLGPLLVGMSLVDAGPALPETLASRWQVVESAVRDQLARGSSSSSSSSSSSRRGGVSGSRGIHYEVSFMEDCCAVASFWKGEGNQEIAAGHADLACMCYRNGMGLVDLIRDSATVQARRLFVDLANNNAAACLRLHRFQDAASSATEALRALVEHGGIAEAKARFRRGRAQMMMRQYVEAMVDLRVAAELSPQDESIHSILRECEAHIRN